MSKTCWACFNSVGTAAAAAAKPLQLCPTLCDPIDSSPSGFPVPGILQARTLEWVAISFSNAWKWKKKVKSLSRVRLLATPWTAAHQAPPSMGFSRQEYWSGLLLPSPKRTLYHTKLSVGIIQRKPLIFLIKHLKLTEKWIKKMWYIYTMECYSDIKKNEIMSFALT